MSDHPTFRKVFDGVATREELFSVFNRHRDDAGADPLCGAIYAGEWFEILESEYRFMLALLPPLFQRTGMFGLSEYKSGYVTSVFFSIRIRGRERWFHGFCFLSNKSSPDVMRASIAAYETGAVDSMTREEKLQAIWDATPADLQGGAGNANPEVADHRRKRAILVNASGQGTVVKLLEDLSDREVDELLSATRLRRRKGGDGEDHP